jgi:hypothetical protein
VPWRARALADHARIVRLAGGSTVRADGLEAEARAMAATAGVHLSAHPS